MDEPLYNNMQELHDDLVHLLMEGFIHAINPETRQHIDTRGMSKEDLYKLVEDPELTLMHFKNTQ